jgi:TonB family protein
MPNERAKRDADRVFQMILLHSDKKPAAKSAGKDSAAAGPTPAPAAPARSTAAPAPSAAAPALQQSRPASVASPVAGKPAPVAEAPAVTTPAPAAELVLPAPVATPAATPVVAEQKPALAPPAPTGPAAAPNKLELLASVEPEFPSRLLRTLGTGKVVVQFEVAADGTVSQVEVVQSSHRGLDASAVTAVKQWKFKPMSGPASGTTELKFE